MEMKFKSIFKIYGLNFIFLLFVFNNLNESLRRVKIAHNPVLPEIDINIQGPQAFLFQRDINEVLIELKSDRQSVIYKLKQLGVSKIYIRSYKAWDTMANAIVDESNIQNYRLLVPEIQKGDAIIVIPEYASDQIIPEDLAKMLLRVQFWGLYYHKVNPEANIKYHNRLKEIAQVFPREQGLDNVMHQRLMRNFLQHIDMMNTFRFQTKNGRLQSVKDAVSIMLKDKYWHFQISPYLELGKTIWFFPYTAVAYTVTVLPFEIEAEITNDSNLKTTLNQLAEQFERDLINTYKNFNLLEPQQVQELFETLKKKVIPSLKSYFISDPYPEVFQLWNAIFSLIR